MFKYRSSYLSLWVRGKLALWFSIKNPVTKIHLDTEFVHNNTEMSTYNINHHYENIKKWNVVLSIDYIGCIWSCIHTKDPPEE